MLWLFQGKTTFLRQLRLTYDKAGLDAEREAMRLVILLSITRTLDVLLGLLENDADQTKDPSHSKESAYRHRLRLSPLLGLESDLRTALGGLAAGPTAPSLVAHAAELAANKDGIQTLRWRDPVVGKEDDPSRSSIDLDAPNPDGPSANDRLQQLRSRNNSPTTVDREPLFAPRFAEKIGSFAFGNGKDARRAKAQGGEGGATNGNALDGNGVYHAGKDDPVHLLAALKDEVMALWQDTVKAGLIMGEGPRQTTQGGFEMTESAKYFLRSLDRISRADWLPSDDDLLNVRVRTLGIEHHYLDITPTQRYRMCDVAGARGVKHAWAPYFEGEHNSLPTPRFALC